MATRNQQSGKNSDGIVIILVVVCLLLGSLFFTYVDKRVEKQYRNEPNQILTDPESYYLNKFDESKDYKASEAEDNREFGRKRKNTVVN